MQAIKTYAETHHLSLGKAASELIRRGLRYQIPLVERDGLLVITPERVQQLLDEE